MTWDTCFENSAWQQCEHCLIKCAEERARYATSAFWARVQYGPDLLRGEWINVGILFFRPGEDVRLLIGTDAAVARVRRIFPWVHSTDDWISGCILSFAAHIRRARPTIDNIERFRNLHNTVRLDKLLGTLRVDADSFLAHMYAEMVTEPMVVEPGRPTLSLDTLRTFYSCKRRIASRNGRLCRTTRRERRTMKTVIEDVLETFDYGRQCFDVVVSALDIARMMSHGLILIDAEKQRGLDAVTGKEVFKADKVERWARELQDGVAVFGQLTWNFRPEQTEAFYDAQAKQFVIQSGSATLPDSAHRHRAIAAAVDSVAHGSTFDVKQRFSVRIWNLPASEEPKIFYWMNQEGDKATSTRSKWLHQKSVGERLAEKLVRGSPHLGQDNVETVSNTLSTKNARLVAFNTIAVACDHWWGPSARPRGMAHWAPIEEADLDDVGAFLVRFWDALVKVRPELRKCDHRARAAWRKTLLSVAAIGIYGFVGLARRSYAMVKAGMRETTVLDGLRKFDPEAPDGDHLLLDLSHWRALGVCFPGRVAGSVNIRNSFATRLAVEGALARRAGLYQENSAAAE